MVRQKGVGIFCLIFISLRSVDQDSGPKLCVIAEDFHSMKKCSTLSVLKTFGFFLFYCKFKIKLPLIVHNSAPKLFSTSQGVPYFSKSTLLFRLLYFTI